MGQTFELPQNLPGPPGDQADEELVQMRKTCAAIMGFVHNHPEQLPRVRRYREYYMPTTRKLLNTALGLGESTTRTRRKSGAISWVSCTP